MDLIIFFTLPLFLFFLGLSGIFLNRKNIILIFIFVELLLFLINFNFLVSSLYLYDSIGQIFSIFILTVAAAESSIGLAILVIYYRIKGTVGIEFVNLLKG
jgi:NADH-quinone oxidoreductase subunit K